MSDVGERWSQLGERMQSLVTRLNKHFEETGRSDRASAATEPLEKLQASVNDAFDAAGNAVHDAEVQADVRETGRLFLEALSVSLHSAAEHLRDKPPTDPPATEPPATEPPATEPPATDVPPGTADAD